MVFKTPNLNYSTVLSITFMQCCKIVLMFYNGWKYKTFINENFN